MTVEILFLIIYFTLLILAIIIEVYLLTSGKIQYIKQSCKAIKYIINCNTSMSDAELAKEISRYYNEYRQESPKIKKFFPNVVMWLDSIIYRIDSQYKSAECLEPYPNLLKRIRDILEAENSFNECDKVQQDILSDISKMTTENNELLVSNILSRTENEFLRLNVSNRKNFIYNIISITIGIAGIIVSVLMAFIKF